MDYPEDAFYDAPRIHLVGRDSLTVEGCRGVILCTEGRIALDMGDFIATIYGSGMSIDELSLARMDITAQITAVALDLKGAQG